MITKIIASGLGLSNLSFADEIKSMKTYYCGPNECGKTSRMIAMQLTINGYVPGAGKNNAEILDTFGNGDMLHVGVELDNHRTFERLFRRDADGQVSQEFRVDGQTLKSKGFFKSMGQCQAPVIVDITEFYSLSDNKKINKIFDLFPPSTDLQKLSGDIDAKRRTKNSLAKSISTTTAVKQSLAKSRAGYQLVGTLAEVESEIARINAELKLASEALNKKIAYEAAEKARLEANQKARDEADALAAKETEKAADMAFPEQKPISNGFPMTSGTGGRSDPLFETGSQPEDHGQSEEIVPFNYNEDFVGETGNLQNKSDVFTKIIEAVEGVASDSGCDGICPVVITIKTELIELKGMIK